MSKLIAALSFVFVFSIFAGIGLGKLPYIASPQASLHPYELTGETIVTEEPAVFHNKKMSVPSSFVALAPEPSNTSVLGVNDNNKRIEIDLTNQRLYAYEGSNRVHEFLVSTGKWGRTPTGEFNIWIKLESTRMRGGSQALGTYYNLPNVPYTMYFYNDKIPKSRGYGIHGAYWHNNFGNPMSHGCINMKPEEAKILYDWATPVVPEGKRMVYTSADNPGTPITIYGTAPKN
jgi:lipoprotein-anchoring transpeptidase ErfK/SrfK